MKNAFLVGLLCLSMLSNAQRAFDEYLLDKNFKPFSSSANKALPTATSDAVITVNASNEGKKVRQSIFGQNAVGWQGNIDTTAAREKHWKNANFSLLRYPGGNWSNIFFWDGNLPSSILNESALNGNVNNLKKGTDAWMLETDEFPQLLNYTGAQGMVCVNVGYAFYGTSADPVTTAADYAAAWVNQYNNVDNHGVKYWELGNENYGPWQAGFDLATPVKYANACVTFAQKMKAQDPTIKVGVVLYEGEGGFNATPQAKDWNEQVLPIVKDIADFLIIHHYPHPNTNQNAIAEPAIYDAVAVVEESMEMIHNQVQTYTGKAKDFYPVVTSEFNMRAGIRNMSRTNALFTTMMLAEYAKHDYSAVTQWDLQNGFDTEKGDHGLVSSRDPFLAEGSVNPEFYPFYYMDRYFGDQIVGSSSDHSDIVSYATTFLSGEIGLIVINRGSSDKVVDINLNGFSAGSKMYWHTLNGDDSDFDRTVYVNGVGPGTSFTVGQSYTSNKGSNDNTLVATAYEQNGVSGPQNYETIAPYSASITSGNFKFDAPKFSVSYLVIEGSATGCLVPELGDAIELCSVTSATLDGTVANASASYVWKKDGAAVGNSAVYEATSAGTYSVEVQIPGCPLAVDQVVISSQLPVVKGDTVCNSGDLATLEVLSMGNFLWFDQAQGGNSLSGQANFGVNVLSSTTYYVQNSDSENFLLGKSSIDGSTYGNTGTGVYDSHNRSIVLTLEQELKLDSFKVFVQTNGTNLVVNITGNNLSYSNSWSFNNLSNANDGANTIQLDATLQAGEYTIDFKGTSGGIKIQYDNASNQSLTGVGSFVVGGGNTSWYGMLYDIAFSKGNACARTPVEAVLDPMAPKCVVTSNPSYLGGSLKVYPNPTSGIVNLSQELSFEVRSIAGQLLMKGRGKEVDLSQLSKGIYIIETSAGSVKVEKR